MNAQDKLTEAPCEPFETWVKSRGGDLTPEYTGIGVSDYKDSMTHERRRAAANSGAPSVLVFAETYREAKRLGWEGTRGWIAEEYTDVRVHRLRQHEAYLMTLWDGEHRVVDDQPTCPVCEQWGNPLRADGNGCAGCGGDDVQPNASVKPRGEATSA